MVCNDEIARLPVENANRSELPSGSRYGYGVLGNEEMRRSTLCQAAWLDWFGELCREIDQMRVDPTVVKFNIRSENGGMKVSSWNRDRPIGSTLLVDLSANEVECEIDEYSNEYI